MKKYIKEFIKFSIIFVLLLNLISYYKSQDLNKNKLQYDSFILINKDEYKISNDKPLLIYFWATWCPICNLQSQNIQRMSKYYEVITIVPQENLGKIEEYMKKNNLTFKVVNDESGLISQNFNISSFPTTLIYDNEKNLKFSDVGYTSTIGLYVRMLLT